MERYETEAFLTLAEELHFGRTADRLTVSTAHVSKTIKRLERRIGVPLFIRTSRHVELTPIGLRLYSELAPGYEQIQRAVAEAIAAGRGIAGVLRVGFVGAAAGEIVFTATDAFRKRYPDSEVQRHEVMYSQELAALRRDEIDVLLTGYPVLEDDISVGPVLLTDDCVLAVSVRHPLARRSTVTLDDLAGNTVPAMPAAVPEYWVKTHLPDRTPSGHLVERGPVASSFLETLAMVSSGNAVCPVGAQAARFYTRADIAYVPISDAPPLEWGLVWRTDRETNRVRTFAQTASEFASVSGGTDPVPRR